eukprot:CAMPEP_0185610752 /NCGR_PEP_ID=MMETSP0436-20130131/13113_2 /TAXON_ID=626734 ORGANISM="Favella taraikaensis, Strain Fe Narragansett Bay" /NCGR_SAMPLE_ID=MMETSP0436 /ASSEMBLY_ACC=CAM_ASM_000390 /LENGTH=186 /DNA_ID=CAMNT_0028243467 /DNA_START=42 /DNA_END=603 /DNA_ORIENTATION=-
MISDAALQSRYEASIILQMRSHCKWIYYSATAFFFLLIGQTPAARAETDGGLFALALAARLTALGGTCRGGIILLAVSVARLHDLAHVHVLGCHGEDCLDVEARDGARLEVLFNVVGVAESASSLLAYLSLLLQVGLASDEVNEDLGTCMRSYVVEPRRKIIKGVLASQVEAQEYHVRALVENAGD